MTGHPWNPPTGEALRRRQAEMIGQIDGLRERALGLERQAVADRQTTWSQMGRFEQMQREAGADDLEKRAMRLRRTAAEIEWKLGA